MFAHVRASLNLSVRSSLLCERENVGVSGRVPKQLISVVIYVFICLITKLIEKSDDST